jgi:hypothetical protein
MRKRLMAAAAIAPLTLFGLHPAFAQTIISNSQSKPLLTAGAGDVTIDSGGTLNINGSGTAVTINSNNSVTNTGTIQSKNVNDAVGIGVAPGAWTGSIFNESEISLSEDYTASDSLNSDGITEAPFAQGTNRIGIQALGTLTGDINNSGSIDIQGNNSTGIFVGAGINGSLLSTGAITVTGDNTFGIRTAGTITGAVQISNAISVKGQNAIGLQTGGPINGALTFYSTVSATGYAVTTRVTGTTALQNIEKTPTDVEQGGVAVQVQGSVLGGIFVGAPPVTTDPNDTVTDADGDGIVDSVEGTGAITSFGSAPALQIGSTNPITIGNFGTGNNAFGLIIEGTVSGSGVFDGFSSTAIDIGAGGGGVNLGGGISIVGAVSATSFQADATAIHLESGTIAPKIQVTGSVTSSVTSAGANTATALVIDQGATVNSLFNFAQMIAATTGDAANATVVVDHSGTLSMIENTGNIDASLTAGAAGETITGKGIALDLQANTTGVTIRQEFDGVNAPTIIGDVLLGNGPNTIQLLSGSIQGALQMGNGATGSITIDNGANYIGALTYGGTGLSINVINGTLQNNSATTLGLSSLTVGASGKLIVALDPQKNASTVYNVSGAANFAPGAAIGATLLSVPTGPQTFTIVKAGSLSVGATDSSLLVSLPFLFNGSIQTNPGAGTINLTVSTKSAADLGLNRAETSAFSAVISALPHDTGIQTAVVSSVTRANFVSAYDQLLPDSGGDVFQTALAMSKAVSRATADRFDLSTQADDDEAPSEVGMWASEFYTGVEQSKGDNNAYHSAGLGVIGGIDFGGYGATLSMASANVTRPGDNGGDSLNSISTVEGGFYAAPRFGPLNIDARLAGAYLKMTDRRQFVANILSGDTSTATTVSRSAEGDWNGYDLSGHIGAGLQADVTKHLFFQPRVYADFFHVHEDGYSERGGGDGFDLDVNNRESTQTSATASLVTGMKFGTSFIFSPQLEIGYDDVIQGGPGNTTARFAYGGPSFTVQPNSVGGAAMARVSLKGDGNYVHFSFQGGGEFRSGYHALDLRAVFRMTY